MQLFLLGKVETSKYPDAETWHPESIGRKSYYRLCNHFWWSSGTAPSEKFRSNLGPQSFFLFFNFYLILQEFCDFAGTWNLHYLIFLRMCSFSRTFGFLQNFWFFGSKLDPKMDQNHKFSVNSIWAKFQNFGWFFKQCVCLIGLALVTLSRYKL